MKNTITNIFTRGFVLIFILLYAAAANAQVANYNPQELRKIDIVEHLGRKIPLDLTFTNDKGETLPLSEYFNKGKPVIIVLAYYDCPMLCTLVLNGLADAAKAIPFLPGKDYTILTISIDPTETAKLAASKKKNYIENIGKPGIDDGWMFFVGKESQSKKLADALGFKYYYIPEKKQYAHPAVLHVLTQDGRISRYLYGIQYKPNDLRLSLLEASRGKIGNTIDRLLLYCYHYDPDAKGYSLFAGNVMRIGGLATVGILVIFLGGLWMTGRRKKNTASANGKKRNL